MLKKYKKKSSTTYSRYIDKNSISNNNNQFKKYLSSSQALTNLKKENCYFVSLWNLSKRFKFL